MRSKISKGNGKSKRLIFILLIAVVTIIGIVLICIKFLSKSSESKNIDVKKPDDPVVEKQVQIIDINSKTRPYAVMINCLNEALPQSGLDKAYIVYELMVEYGITRMFALFKDVDFDKVGSVRSVRSQYLPYLFENDAILVHAGGQKETIDRIANEGITHIDVDGQYGVRDGELAKKRAWEHTLFTNSNLLSKAVSNMNIRSTTDTKNLLTYSASELDLYKYETKDAKNISIKYSNYRTSNYSYDENSKTYLRSMNGTKNVDLVSGKQYQVKNIIVYGAKYTTYTLRGTGYQKIEDITSGEGYYITDGVVLPITWSKSSEKAQTVYKIKEDGKELVVNDGNTYIQIYPSNGGNLSIS